MGVTLIRIDKNGTKYYASDTCPRCGGAGGSDAWAYTGWTCYECGGTGRTLKPRIFKEYTPEYAAKLAERRKAKAIKKAPEVNAKLFSKLGFSVDGKAWIVLGNTYEIKDDLKAAGARYHEFIGWHFDHETSYPCAEISIEDIAEKTDVGTWDLFPGLWIQKTIKEIKNKNAPKTESRWIGSVGDKIELDVKFKRSFSFETHFTYRGETNFIYKFADEEGNTVMWKTGKHLDLEENHDYKISGTIKAHDEYKGDKQTVLTRCKIS